MTDPPTDSCDCGTLEDSAWDPEHPIGWNPDVHEYFIAYGSGGRQVVRFCPFCGGSAPPSRRASLFAHITGTEEDRLASLVSGLRSVSDVTARLGPPDATHEAAVRVGCGGYESPERGEAFDTMVYSHLSDVADVVFELRGDQVVRGSWVSKYVGPELA